MSHESRIDELTRDSPSLLKEIILHDSKYSDRLLVQIKCVEKFKWEESQRQKRDIGWEGAWELWVNKGLARRYSEVYQEDMPFNVLYKEIINF